MMRCYNHEETIARMNQLAAQDIPYIFVINYQATQAYVIPLDEIDPDEMMFCFGEIGNIPKRLNESQQGNIPKRLNLSSDGIQWNYQAPDRAEYARSFNIVQQNELAGNSYLVNLTCKVPVSTNLSLRDIFLCSQARYRLWIRDQLVCFSPEIFIRLDGDVITSYPMKGTISAAIPDADKVLMADSKEMAEHATIVDLIRNDISRVADQVTVPRYRYIEQLHTNCGPILQSSSEIRGIIQPYYKQHPGDMLQQQLPAGSITGAPKPKTLQIIEEAEGYDRGFYTGVMGIWKDGNIDSAVMIRFIDQEDGQLYYKAGGGITARSEADKEYNEIIEKIYVPVCRNHKD